MHFPAGYINVYTKAIRKNIHSGIAMPISQYNELFKGVKKDRLGGLN